ncbi:MAG TPA: hypothetical protein VMP11_17725 [Verrucomicrobiae bacterium]|nr:hypothetical protein [Verrucomicrobiae bacterium]
MSRIASLLDTDSKRWLAVLAAAVAVSIVFITYSFLKTLSPAEPTVVASQKPAPPPADTPVTRAEPDWNATPASTPLVESAATRPDPFAAQYAAEARDAAAHDPVAHAKAVQHQAGYLRDLISQGKLPQGFGKLTKEQVDDMEKKGVLIE